MKELNIYITEKFKISKDISKSGYSEYLDAILKISLLDKPKYKNIKDAIENWFIKNDIVKLKLYIQSSSKSKKYMSKVDKEIVDKFEVLKFGDSMEMFYKIFGHTHFDDKTKLFADENIDIYGNSKGLYIGMVDFTLIAMIEK